jgi:glycosyltransferase involved in cell wall biosynthesis
MKKAIHSVSIVIPAYNEEVAIKACVEAALNQTEPAEEIIVVDNRSTDKTSKVVAGLQREYPNGHIRLLHENKKQGIIPARNYGFDAARGEIIGRIDADSLIYENWVAEVKSLFCANPKLAAATGPVSYHDMPFREFGLKADNVFRKFVFKCIPKYQLLFGSNMAIRKSAWEIIRSVTAQDPKNTMHEDLDLSLCLKKAGFLLQYAPKMISGVSTRRLDNSPKDFGKYMKRFNNTCVYHGIKDPSLKLPTVIYQLVYFPSKALRYFYLKQHKSTVRKARIS